MIRTLSLRALVFVLTSVPALAIMAIPAYGQASDAPPGNNGTIKIDDVVLDDGNENVPHPGCRFVVDFFGYDVGTRNVTLELEGQEPTGGGMLLVDTFSFEVTSRESGNELNHSRPVDLSDELAAIEPHPQQGWHVKLTVHVDGAQGADVKHKVFWIAECDAAAPATDVADTTVADTTVADTTGVVDAVTAADIAAWNAAVWMNAMRANAAAAAAGQPETAVLSAGAAQETGAGAVPGGTLPRTGPGTSQVLAVLGAMLVGAGATMAGAARRIR